MNDNFYKRITKQLEMRLKESVEKGKLAAELIIANKELTLQNEEKSKLTAEYNHRQKFYYLHRL